jgi:hypothetical protein
MVSLLKTLNVWEDIMQSESRSAALSNVSLEMRAWNIRRKALLMGGSCRDRDSGPCAAAG